MNACKIFAPNTLITYARISRRFWLIVFYMIIRNLYYVFFRYRGYLISSWIALCVLALDFKVSSSYVTTTICIYTPTAAYKEKMNYIRPNSRLFCYNNSLIWCLCICGIFFSCKT